MRFLLCALSTLCACDRPLEPARPTASSAGALTAPESTLHGLVARTPLVAKVTILSTSARWGQMGTRAEKALYTDATARLDAVVRGGEAGETVTFSSLGGELDGTAMQLSGQVSLAPLDELIVFADPTASSHPFLAGRDGVLRVVDGHVFSYDGRPLVSVEQGGFVFGQPAAVDRPAIVPLGKASGFHAPAATGPTLSAAVVLEALAR